MITSTNSVISIFITFILRSVSHSSNKFWGYDLSNASYLFYLAKTKAAPTGRPLFCTLVSELARRIDDGALHLLFEFGCSLGCFHLASAAYHLELFDLPML